MIAWTRRHTLIAGLGLILGVNAIVLGGVAYNRSGEPESLLQLSERELYTPFGRALRNENSGVELALRWRVPVDSSAREPSYGHGYESWGGSPAWLDRTKLEALGFEKLPEKIRFGSDSKWPQAKEVLLVLELDGPAARQAMAQAQTNSVEAVRLAEVNAGNKEFERRAKTAREALARETGENSRLFAIDAGLDLVTLRSKYPDRSRFLIARGQVRPHFVAQGREERVSGTISALSISRVNVPVEWQTALAPAKPGGKVRFSATVAWGKRLEPWLVTLAGSARED